MVVIGGGITGAFAAYFLARQGTRVTLVERDGLAAHASGANPGGLNPLHGPGIPGPLQELALASFRLNVEHWEEIHRCSAVDFSARFVSRLHVAMDDDEAAALAGLGDLHNSVSGFSAEMLSRTDALRLEPRLSPDGAGGLLVHGNACVDPVAYTRAVATAAEQLGARIVPGDVTALRVKSERVTGVVAGSASIGCDGVVIATGASCDAPVRWLGIRLPIEPVKGELLLGSASSGPFACDVSRGEVGVYGSGGRFWLGGIEDRDELDATPTAAGREAILRKVAMLLPGLGPVQVIEHTAALRPVTPDGMPVVGIASAFPNVCFAGGGGRKGMLLGAGLGLAAAELLTDGASRMPVAGCSPDRFAYVS